MKTILESPHKVEIPTIDILTYVFSSGTGTSRRSKQYFDATSPSTCFSMEEAEVMVKRFAQGLQKLGLRADDKVLLYSNNNLFFPVLLWGVIAAQCVFTSASPAATVQGNSSTTALEIVN